MTTNAQRYTSFRHQQATRGSSTLTGLYEANIAIVLNHLNQIDIIKHRHEKREKNLSIDKTIDVMMDMLCRMIFNGRMELFQEGMKIKLCEALNEILKEGEINESSIQRQSDSNGVGSTG